MERELYDLTNPQKSVWLIEQFYKDTCINNICGTSFIDETIDLKKLNEAFNIFFRDNDAFRIRLCIDNNGNIKQYFSEFEKENLTIYNLKNTDELSSLEKEMVNRPFETINGKLYNIVLFKLPNGKGGFIACISHLIGDACTAGLIASKIANIYSSLGSETQSSEVPTSYLEYINSETDYLKSPKFEKDKEYWETHFNTAPDIGYIPSSKKQSTDSCIANRELFTLSKQIVDNINEFCKNNKFTIFNFLMGVYALYIGKVSNLSEFTLGTPILNRSTFVEKNTPGMFISTVPVKFTLKNNISFIEFAKEIATDSLGMLRHQKYPYQNILEHIRKHNPSQPNLYDILISNQNSRTNRNISAIPYSVKWIFNNNVADSMQIHIYDMNDLGSLDIAYDYRVNKYTKKEISDIHKRICNIISQILNNNNIYLNEIEIVTPEEKNIILNEFNNTYLAYPKNKTVVDYFEEQVSKTPNNVALVFQNRTMTYKELNEKANSLARYLNNNGIGQGSIVGILLNRSFEMIISILAVLKSGAAYIPIDAEYPEDRINYVLLNSNCKTLITLQRQISRIESLGFSGLLVIADLYNEPIYSLDNKNLNNKISQDSLAYLIFTSGSTGNPKGVMLTHKNLNNFINSMFDKVEYLKDGIYHSIISITTMSFDIFAYETIVSLCGGLKLFITDDFEQKITNKFERIIADNNIEIIQSTPSIMNFHLDNSIIDGFSKLKYVVLAGEQLPRKLVDKILFKSPNCTVYNGYGPSETTIFSTLTNVTQKNEITIGKGIANTQIYILNNDYSILPINSVGEIYISGDGVGKGYINRPDLTSSRFLSNPFKPGSIIYKTGDIGYWNENGELLCKGRIDNQIKLRGLRIELGEIENCINSYNTSFNINSAVIVKEVSGLSSLVAFVSSNAPLNTSKLREHIANKLPNYMIPSYFVMLDKLPLTPNGKIDKKALQTYKVEPVSISSTHTKPRNETERIIVDSIEKKLGILDFGIDDNIFDYGADSLSIINILTDLFQYKISLKVYDFYKFPTVRELYDKVLFETAINAVKDTSELLRLDDIVSKFTTSTTCKKVSDKKSILLTGSTGFLGIHILADLLENIDSVKKIYCFIRPKYGQNIYDRLINKLHFYFNTKYDELFKKYVVCINSDMILDHLGLSAPDFDSLKGNVDTVIHCAANVKHYGDYSLFEKVNIKGTSQIIELCKTLNAHLHYISTMTISGNYLIEQNVNSTVFNEKSFYIKQDFSDNVYSKSKLIAESLVINAISNGLDATIYRIGDLSSRYTDGQFQSNINENAVYSRLKSMLEISAIPDSILENTLELTPVDYASHAIHNIIWSNNCRNRIFHIYNPNMISVKETLVYMEKLGHKIKVLPQEKFVQLVKSISNDSLNQSKISGIINDFTKDDDMIYNHIINTDNSISSEYLKNLGFRWPELSFEYFSKVINYMKKVGFLK